MNQFKTFNRAERLKEFIDRLHQGETVDQVKADFQKEFGTVSAGEIANAERRLVEAGIPVEEVQRLCDVHQTLFEDQVISDSDLEQGHPAFVFQMENEGIEAHLRKVEQSLTKLKGYDAKSFEPLINQLTSLKKLDTHYARKENLMFPFLEARGITAPPKVMWGVDDEIRAQLKELIRQAERVGSADTVIHQAKGLLEKVRSMIGKENNILIPMLMENLTEDDWKMVARESRHIGYVFTDEIEGASPSDATVWETGEDNLDMRGDVALPSGHFTYQELTSLLNTLPGDITFIGSDNRVRYFSEGKDRVFPRTRTIIGRDVANCHPPKSLSVVDQLIEEFRSGKKDQENFWIQRGGAFVLIRYYAVRDEGEYLGVLEVTEEISHLRSLEGEKRLLED